MYRSMGIIVLFSEQKGTVSLIRFGVIGTNWIVDNFIQAGKEVQGFAVTAVYSRTEERAAAFADGHNIPERYTNLEEMLASDSVDAVYIASPNFAHAQQAIQCMDRGKHVLCEKPIASNKMEATAMIEAAKRNGVLLMEALMTTFLPNFAAIRDGLKELGTIRRVVTSFNQYSSRYDAFRAGQVLNAFKPELSNGALMDLGVYCIYPIVRLFGPPQSVKANGVMLSSGVDGEGSLLLPYEGMEAVVMYSKISTSHVPCEIQGEDGTLVYYRASQPNRVELHTRGGGVTDLTRPQSDHSMSYEIAEFMELIRQGEMESPVNSFEVTLQTMGIMDEARRQMGLVYPADRKPAI